MKRVISKKPIGSIRLFIKPRSKKIGRLLVSISFLLLLSTIPYFAGPGLSSPEPVGAYLNGTFPNSLYSGNQLYRPAFPNINFFLPIIFEPVPTQNKNVVAQLSGEIYWFDNDEQTTTKSMLLDLSGQVGMVWDSGFLGLTFHPRFNDPVDPQNYIYVYYSTRDRNGGNEPTVYQTQGCYDESEYGSYLVLERYAVDPVTLTGDFNSRTKLIVRKLFGDTHRGGGLGFGDDGFLYLTTGDQSAWHKSQDIANNMDGAVLRIDVDMQGGAISHPPIRKLQDNPISGVNYNSTWYTNNAGPHPSDGSGGVYDKEFSGVNYYIPNDNPFLSPSGSTYEEYYTIGNRSPHRMFKDKLTGIFYMGEVGLSTHEEINVILSGKNYGWPIYEGNDLGPNSSSCATMYNNTPHELPLTEFRRSDANSIVGGFVYRGTEIPEYYGKYICADYGSGDELFIVDIETGDYEILGIFEPQNVISFGQDAAGELYILHAGFNTTLFKMVSGGVPQYDAMPQTLSATGAFEVSGNGLFEGEFADLKVTDGIIPYEMVESFWSDGALKRRWLSVPNNGTHNSASEQIKYSENGDWDFPEGSVLIKHFDLNTDKNNPSEIRKVETRFSIKGQDGNFYFLSYNWNENQTDAVLQEVGLDENVEITNAQGQIENQTWHFPSQSECFACHNSANKGALGLRTRYLNRDMTYDDNGTLKVANQLVTLSHLGILDESITDLDTPNLLTHKSLSDPNATLEEKARSYLDLNCAYCHRPDTDNRGQFDLRRFNDLEATGILLANISSPLNIDPDEKILFPGDASRSILFHRMNSIDPTIMMPPLAKSIIDQPAVNLIEQWINQLESPDTNLNSPNVSTNLALLPSAVVSGSISNERGVPEEVLYDPRIGDYFMPTTYNEYGVAFGRNLGTIGIEDAFEWRVDWSKPKLVNYITLGGAYDDQPQPDTMWRVSYLNEGTWTTIDQGQGGWIDDGIFEWGGSSQLPVKAEAIRFQAYSDGNSDLVNIHLRARGGVSNTADDSATTPKASLIQYVPLDNTCGLSIPGDAYLFCNDSWKNNDIPDGTTETKDVYIGNGTFTVAEDETIVVNNLEISIGARLIIEEGGSVTVKGDLLNNGTVNLLSTSTKYSSLLVEGTSSGNINYKRHINSFSSNDLVASPLKDNTFGDFASKNINLYENPNNSDQKLFGPFNESTGEYELYSETTNSSTPLDIGKGYRTARNSSEDGVSGTTFTFSGEIETSAVAVPITSSGSTFDGWNLVGNPYPSYLLLSAFLTQNNTEFDSNSQGIYGYDGDASNGWTKWNQAYSDANPGKLIAPGQGFFVKSKSGGGTVNFTPNMAISGNDDDFILGRNSVSAHFGYLKIEANAQSELFNTEFYFNSNASTGLDPGYDASLFGGIAPEFSIYSHLVENDTGMPFGVQALSNNDMNNVVIPLGLNASQGQNITISIAQSDLPSSIDIYLDDTLNNTSTLLTTDNYSFSLTDNSSGIGRFYLRLASSALGIFNEQLDDFIIFTNSSDRTVNIEGTLDISTTFNLYDLHGRVVKTDVLQPKEQNYSLDVSDLSSGIYIVKLTGANNSLRIEKIIIR